MTHIMRHMTDSNTPKNEPEPNPNTKDTNLDLPYDIYLSQDPFDNRLIVNYR